MNAITALTPQQLRKAADLQEKILALQSELSQLLGAPVQTGNDGPAALPQKKRTLSPQAIANIRAGAQKRWAAVRAAKGPAPKGAAPKRKISAAGKKRLSELAKKRWAAVHAAGRSKL